MRRLVAKKKNEGLLPRRVGYPPGEKPLLFKKRKKKNIEKKITRDWRTVAVKIKKIKHHTRNVKDTAGLYFLLRGHQTP